jgi:hypothetical protein
MKSLSTLLVLTVLATASCNKSEDNNATPPAAKSYWTLGSNTYNVNNFTLANNTYYAYDTAGNGIGFSFEPYPTAAGSFAVINDTASLGPQQVKVFAFGYVSGSTYFATGNDNKAVAVSFEGSQIKIVMPDVWVKRGNDSLKATANLDKL